MKKKRNQIYSENISGEIEWNGSQKINNIIFNKHIHARVGHKKNVST